MGVSFEVSKTVLLRWALGPTIKFRIRIPDVIFNTSLDAHPPWQVV